MKPEIKQGVAGGLGGVLITGSVKPARRSDCYFYCRPCWRAFDPVDQPSLIFIFIRGGNLSTTTVVIFITAVLYQVVVVVVLACIKHLLCQFL